MISLYWKYCTFTIAIYVVYFYRPLPCRHVHILRIILFTGFFFFSRCQHEPWSVSTASRKVARDCWYSMIRAWSQFGIPFKRERRDMHVIRCVNSNKDYSSNFISHKPELFSVVVSYWFLGTVNVCYSFSFYYVGSCYTAIFFYLVGLMYNGMD